MGMMPSSRARRIRPCAAALAAALFAGAGPAWAEETEAARAARWHDVAAAIFPGRTIADNSGLLVLEAPPRALDAALVPVTITIRPEAQVKSLTLVIDDNPAPVAARFAFGPLADPHRLKTRVRVDQYTLIHAVAELADGSLVSAARYIKAAGGCSAPGAANLAEAMARIGRMKFRLADAATPGGGATGELLISHPNLNGMQMDPVTRFYTPARYVQSVKVTQGGALVFTMEGDISLSEDPAITFGFRQNSAAPLDVEVDDSAKAVFRQSFPAGPRPS